MKNALYGLVICLSLTGSAFADNLRAKCDKMDREAAAALKKLDVAAFDKCVKVCITPDFKYIEDGKEITWEQMVSTMKMSMAGMQKCTKSEAHTTNYQIKGDKATSTSTHVMAGILKAMPEDKSGKTHTIMYAGSSKNSYVKVGGIWKMSRMEWKTTKMLMDGKPMQMGAK